MRSGAVRVKARASDRAGQDIGGIGGRGGHVGTHEVASNETECCESFDFHGRRPFVESALRSLGQTGQGARLAERCPFKYSEHDRAISKFAFPKWCPRPDLNRDKRFRKPLLYPVELRGRSDAKRRRPTIRPPTKILGKQYRGARRIPLLGHPKCGTDPSRIRSVRGDRRRSSFSQSAQAPNLRDAPDLGMTRALENPC